MVHESLPFISHTPLLLPCPALLPHSVTTLPCCSCDVSVNTVQYISQYSASILKVSHSLSSSLILCFPLPLFFYPPLSSSLSFHRQWPPNRLQSGLTICWLYIVCEMMAVSLCVCVCVNAVLGLALTVHVGVDITLGLTTAIHFHTHTHWKCRGIRVTWWHPVGDLSRFFIQIHF